MAFPSHRRHVKSESSISIDDMIDWSDEEPMEEEQAPHLLGSISAMDSFGMVDDRSSPGPPSSNFSAAVGAATMVDGNDPLSRRDSVLNPSPLVLSVRKIYPDEEASASDESSTFTFPSVTTTFASKAATPCTRLPMMPPRPGGMDSQAPRRVSDSSDHMVVDDNDSTSCPTTTTTSSKTPHRRSTHRRDSVDSLPTPRDLDDVIMSFRVLA